MPRLILRWAAPSAFSLALLFGLWLLPRLAHAQTPAPAQDVTAADQPAIVMTMTVGVEQDGCATTDSVTALPTTIVRICYTVYNSGDVTFTNHALSGQDFVPRVEQILLPPGATITRTRSAQFAATTKQTDIWAANSGPGSTQVQAQGSIAVTVISPAVEATLTVGQVPGSCAAGSQITIPANSAAVFCLTLTNTGDAPLTHHMIDIPALAISGTASFPLGPGQVQIIDDSNATSLGLPANFIRANVGANLSAVATVQSSTDEGYKADASSTALVTVGTGATTLLVTVAQTAPCGTASTINPLRNTDVYYCLNLTNSGTVSLTNFQFASVAPAIQGSFSYTLTPGAKVVVDNPFLTGRGAQAVLGPYQATTSISPNFVVTSTNASGFRVVSNGSVTVAPVDPTATWTPTWTPIPPTPTWTPFPTWTPSPTWTPFPTWSPTWTPEPTLPPTPTWTRSFELSNLETPTPFVVIAGDPQGSIPAPDFEATNIAALQTAEADALATNAALAFPTTPPPPSPLETPTPETEIVMLEAPIAEVEATVTASSTPTDEPSPTPSPTIRPLEAPTATALPDIPTLFSQVLSSTMTTLGVIWLLLGSLVFFAVAGIVAGLSFRQSERRRFDLYALEEEEMEEAGLSAPPSVSPPEKRNRDDDDHWPTSLQ